MDDTEAFARLGRLNLDPELRAWLGSRQLAAAKAKWTSTPRRLAYAGTRGEFIAGPAVAPRAWASRGEGAARIAQAALNPNAWIDLRAGRTRRAWHAAIDAALESLARIDSELANAFAFGKYRDAPGSHLRERGGRVQLLWRPAPGLVVDVSSP